MPKRSLDRCRRERSLKRQLSAAAESGGGMGAGDVESSPAEGGVVGFAGWAEGQWPNSLPLWRRMSSINMLRPHEGMSRRCTLCGVANSVTTLTSAARATQPPRQLRRKYAATMLCVIKRSIEAKTAFSDHRRPVSTYRAGIQNSSVSSAIKEATDDWRRHGNHVMPSGAGYTPEVQPLICQPICLSSGQIDISSSSTRACESRRRRANRAGSFRILFPYAE